MDKDVGPNGGGAGLAAAPALRVLTYLFLVLTIAFLGRGWYLHLRHPSRTVWQRRSRAMLAASSTLAIVLWGLRFGGLLGPQPF
ncbi:MAG: hypothetical protein V3U26_04270 [Dehalococcoidia bacterium]